MFVSKAFAVKGIVLQTSLGDHYVFHLIIRKTDTVYSDVPICPQRSTDPEEQTNTDSCEKYCENNS